MQGYLITLYEIENVPQSSRQMFLRIPRSHFFQGLISPQSMKNWKCSSIFSPNVSQDSKISLFSRSHFTSVDEKLKMFLNLLAKCFSGFQDLTFFQGLISPQSHVWKYIRTCFFILLIFIFIFDYFAWITIKIFYSRRNFLMKIYFIYTG
jgi:hypothetical protein